MIIRIPGDRSVSHDFFEVDRENLERQYDVGIDTGPGGVVEVSGEEENVNRFLDDHGMTMDDVEVDGGGGEPCPECGAPPGMPHDSGCPLADEPEYMDPDIEHDSRVDKKPPFGEAHEHNYLTEPGAANHPEDCECAECKDLHPKGAQNESADFDKFMSRIISEETKRGIPVLADSPLRKNAARYQERPMGRTRIGGR